MLPHNLHMYTEFRRNRSVADINDYDDQVDEMTRVARASTVPSTRLAPPVLSSSDSEPLMPMLFICFPSSFPLQSRHEHGL